MFMIVHYEIQYLYIVINDNKIQLSVVYRFSNRLLWDTTTKKEKNISVRTPQYFFFAYTHHTQQLHYVSAIDSTTLSLL
jgi:hypothetical protein